MVRVNKLCYICTIKYKRNANLDSHVHRDGQMSKPKLTKSQMEDTKQLCSTLRMRSCMSSLRLRPSLWYQMQVSDACKMALWPGSAWGEAIPYSCLEFSKEEGGKLALLWDFSPETPKQWLAIYIWWYYSWFICEQRGVSFSLSSACMYFPQS